MNLYFIYTGSTGFPQGDAYTNRILTLAKGMRDLGCGIKVLIIYPGRKIDLENSRGVYNHISYEYMTPLKVPKTTLQKKVIGIFGILKTMYFFLTTRERPNAVISFTRSYLQNKCLSLVIKIKGILFVREINEFPKSVLKKGLNGFDSFDRFVLKRTNSCFDAWISISNGIKDFLNTYIHDNPILITPIVVDMERFKSVSQPIIESEYITYCGYLYGNKDGIDILIQAFARISERYPKLKLLLIGDTEKSQEFKNLSNKLKDYKIDDRVIFTGYVPREEVPRYLLEAKVLVLARPNNIQSKGGLPTKLGEYLATGKPVLVTSVGDIPLYIQNDINGFLAIPGSIDSFAERLDEILKDYPRAKEIGMRGKKLAEEIFDPVFQCRQICEFIKQLRN